jgi:hypothetical protein
LDRPNTNPQEEEDLINSWNPEPLVKPVDAETDQKLERIIDGCVTTQFVLVFLKKIPTLTFCRYLSKASLTAQQSHYT